MRVLRLYKAASQGSPNNRPATSGFPMAYSRIKDVCILLLESKEKKYFWKSCFFFFSLQNTSHGSGNLEGGVVQMALSFAVFISTWQVALGI